MPQLFVLSGRDVGKSFEVNGPVTLGRATTCSIRLADRSVSREHARIEEEDGRWYVVDLGARNGVRMQGKRVKRAELNDHDEILLGELPLRFRTDAEVPAAPAAPPKPTPAPKAEADDGGAFELEEEIDLGATVPATELPKRRIAPEPEPEPEPEQPPAAEELTERDRMRARILAESSKPAGVLSADLSQRPLVVRWGAYLLVVAVMAGVFYGAYKLVAYMRGAGQ